MLSSHEFRLRKTVSWTLSLVVKKNLSYDNNYTCIYIMSSKPINEKADFVTNLSTLKVLTEHRCLVFDMEIIG